MRPVSSINPDGEVARVDGLENVSIPTMHGLWRERMALTVRLSPNHVEQFKPVSESGFRKSRLIRVVGPLIMKASRFELDQWIVRKETNLVGTLMIRADLTGNRSHEIRLALDPEWQSELAAPLVQQACQRLAPIPAKGSLIEVGGHEVPLCRALLDAGFEDMSVWHWLGTDVGCALAKGEKKSQEVLTT